MIADFRSDTHVRAHGLQYLHDSRGKFPRWARIENNLSMANQGLMLNKHQPTETETSGTFMSHFQFIFLLTHLKSELPNNSLILLVGSDLINDLIREVGLFVCVVDWYPLCCASKQHA